MQHEIRLPDIEVLVRAADFDVAAFAFFRSEGSEDTFELICGIDSKSSANTVIEALQACIKACKRANWKSLDELGAAAGEGYGEPPF